jgi:hypothetical protein
MIVVVAIASTTVQYALCSLLLSYPSPHRHKPGAHTTDVAETTSHVLASLPILSWLLLSDHPFTAATPMALSTWAASGRWHKWYTTAMLISIVGG